MGWGWVGVWCGVKVYLLHSRLMLAGLLIFTLERVVVMDALGGMVWMGYGMIKRISIV